MEGKSPLFDDLQLFWGKRLEGTLYTPKRRTPIKPRRNANELNRFGRESLVKRFKMSFVSLSDVNRMRKSVVMDEGMSNLMESTQRKDLLRQRSNDRIRNWPNTLDNQRIKKENFLRDKELVAEQERQALDVEEARVRANTRLETISRANEMLFQQTDKMKFLKVQIGYAEALHGRKVQVLTKQESKKMLVEEEENWHKIKMEKVAQGEAEEQAKIDSRQEIIAKIKKSRKEQVDDVRARRQQVKDEEQAIGDAMRRRAKEQVEEEVQRQIEKEAKQAKSNADLVVANEQFKAIRNSVRARALEEQEAREAEVHLIDARAKARKDLEKKRFQAKLDQRQKIIDKAVELLAKKSNSEMALMHKQADEKKAKDDAIEAAKQAKREAQAAAIKVSREQMIQDKYNRWQKERDSEEAMIASWGELRDVADEKEKAKVRKARESTKLIKDIQRAEGIERNRAKIHQKLAEAEEANLLLANSGNDEEKFAVRTKQMIEEYAKAGKPIYTLMKALELKAPALLPALKNKRPERSPRPDA